MKQTGCTRCSRWAACMYEARLSLMKKGREVVMGDTEVSDFSERTQSDNSNIEAVDESESGLAGNNLQVLGFHRFNAAKFHSMASEIGNW
jgi:hypothetical protein